MLMSLLNPSQVSAYVDWFKPAANSAFGPMQALVSGLGLAKDERDARLQVLAMSAAMRLSPSGFVRILGKQVSANPDGFFADALTRLHTKLTNPLDLAVFLHSPAAVDMFEQAFPEFDFKSNPDEEVSVPRRTPIRV